MKNKNFSSLPEADLSPPTRRVLDLLRAAPKPLTAYDILGQLRSFGIKSPPTVYRALEALLKGNLIHRLESLNAFMACQSPTCPDAHHDQGSAVPFVICQSCGHVEAVSDVKLARAIQTMTSAHLAQYDRGVLELIGRCHACVAQNADSRFSSRKNP